MSALDYDSSNEILKIPISPYGRNDKKTKKTTKVNIDLILRFFTVITQTHTHSGRERVTFTYTLGEKRQICICMCVCVCFAGCAYLTGPHLQQGQRTGWLVIRRCCAAGRTSRCPRTRRCGGRGGTRPLGEACVVQIVEPLCIAGWFRARRTLIAGWIVRRCCFWWTPEPLETQFAPFLLFLQQTINKRKLNNNK